MSMKHKFFMFIVMLVVINSPLSAKVRFLTFHYNKPQYIEIQYKMFKKFMRNDYELIVFNDAKDPILSTAIKENCAKYGIKCVRYKQKWHPDESLNYEIAEWIKNPSLTNIHAFISPQPSDIGQQPSVRHCHVIQYALENYGYKHNDIVALVDGDAFPIRPLNIRTLLKKHDIIGIRKEYADIDYLWVVFVAFNPRTMPYVKELKFDIAVVNNILHDTGSYTYHFLNNHPDVNCKKYEGQVGSTLALHSEQALLDKGFTPIEIELIKKDDYPPTEFHLNKRLFHFNTSSFNFAGYEQKEAHVQEFIEKILQEY